MTTMMTRTTTEGMTRPVKTVETDQAWPPLGVKDLKPDTSVCGHAMKFPTLKEKLAAALASSTKEEKGP
jgi:hypothetical protein